MYLIVILVLWRTEIYILYVNGVIVLIQFFVQFIIIIFMAYTMLGVFRPAEEYVVPPPPILTMGTLYVVLFLGCMLKFFFRYIVDLNPALSSWNILVYVTPIAMSETLPC
jgi:hypothetical protein